MCEDNTIDKDLKMSLHNHKWNQFNTAFANSSELITQRRSRNAMKARHSIKSLMSLGVRFKGVFDHGVNQGRLKVALDVFIV